MKEIDKAIESLEQRVYDEAFEYIGIESSDKNKLMQLGHIFHFLGKLKQYTHGLRVTCYTIKMMDYLGIDNIDYRKSFFIAALLHDHGKIRFLDLVDKENNFSKQDKELIKGHVEVGVNMLRGIDSISMAIIERHHTYQKDSYPKILTTLETPEVTYSSKNLGMLDYWDRALIKSESKESAIEKILSEYGNLDFSYSGNIFPKSSRTGKELINELYEAKIFGHENPLNPFQEPNSFIFKR